MFAGPLLLALALSSSSSAEESAVTVEGASCTTYDEDVEVAKLLDGTCEWNTYMCCFTNQDGGEEVTANTDVCRMDSVEMPGESEGSVYCHGFAWESGADFNNHILPLFHFVKNAGRTEEEGGYYGSVEGAPECGCIEEMPQVSFAECSRYSIEGIVGCGTGGLFSQYNGRLGAPYGEMEHNLVRKCDNA
ncbi:unnamed protein product [Ectocarpus fasciculatus]